MAHPSLTVSDGTKYMCACCCEWTTRDKLYQCPKCAIRWDVCDKCPAEHRCLRCEPQIKVKITKE